MNHNRRWFKNRVGRKIYCTDHKNKNATWDKCEGIVLEHVGQVDVFMGHQKRGIEFSCGTSYKESDRPLKSGDVAAGERQEAG